MIKKTILILVMADNSDFTQKELAVVKNTWANPVIEGEYTNIMFLSYTAMTEELKQMSPHKNLGIVNNECDSVYVPTDDDNYASYKKTYVTLKTLEPLIKRYRIDYIFKTTPYTYVNVPLLDEFVQKYIQSGEEVIYTGKIKSAKQAIGPKSFCLFADRSSMLIPVRPYYNVLTEIKYRTDALKNDTVKCSEFWNTYRMNVDENAMGFIIDNYLISLGRDHYEYYRDWNMKTFDELGEDLWHRQIVMNMRHCKCHKCEMDDLRYVHDVVSDYYYSNKKPDLSYILNYMYSSLCPKIYAVDENKDSEIYNQLTFDEYKEVFKKGSLDFMLNIGSGSSNSSSNSSCPSYPYPNGGDNQCYHYSYLDWFNVPHHHIDNCIYHHDYNNQNQNSNSSSVTNNSTNTNNSSVNEVVNVDPNKGQHINISKKHCSCKDDYVVDSSCDCDVPVIDSVRMCVKDENGHKHYVRLYPADYVCDCSTSENIDSSVLEPENPDTVPMIPLVPATPIVKDDNNVDEEPEIPVELPTEPDNTSEDNDEVETPSDVNDNEDDSNEKEDTTDTSLNTSVNDSSCSCFDTSSIWCNCDCGEHSWYHNPENGDGACNSSDGCPQTPEPPTKPVIPDASQIVPDISSCDCNCDCNVADAEAVGKEIDKINNLLDSLLR